MQCGSLSTDAGNLTLHNLLQSDQLDFAADCGKAAAFVARLLPEQLQLENAFESARLIRNMTVMPFPYAEFIAFIRSASPQCFLDAPSGSIVDWVDGVKVGDVMFLTDSDVLAPCIRQICQRLSWEGNPDLAGVGVSILISWYIADSLRGPVLLLYVDTNQRNAVDSCFVRVGNLPRHILPCNIWLHPPRPAEAIWPTHQHPGRRNISLVGGAANQPRLVLGLCAALCPSYLHCDPRGAGAKKILLCRGDGHVFVGHRIHGSRCHVASLRVCLPLQGGPTARPGTGLYHGIRRRNAFSSTLL